MEYPVFPESPIVCPFATFCPPRHLKFIKVKKKEKDSQAVIDYYRIPVRIPVICQIQRCLYDAVVYRIDVGVKGGIQINSQMLGRGIPRFSDIPKSAYVGDFVQRIT